MGKDFRRILDGDFNVPVWVWWILGFIGVLVRLSFVLRGNIAFNSDEAVCYEYIKRVMTNDTADFREGGRNIGGLRYGVLCVFYLVTGGWLYFGALAGILINVFSSSVWILWLYQKVSRAASLGAAVLLSIPPVSIAYFSTHMDERRLETQFWASLLVYFSGTWLQSSWGGLALGAIVGWSFWCEPFILFFFIPVLAHELWIRRDPIFSLEGFSRGFDRVPWGIVIRVEVERLFPRFWAEIPALDHSGLAFRQEQLSAALECLPPILERQFPIWVPTKLQIGP